MHHLGRRIRVSLADGEVHEGEATGIDDLGRLLVHTGTAETAIGAGDVEHVRSA